jgi:CheY-like chemotaxis protein
MKNSNEFQQLPTQKLNIFLADDDIIDRQLFKEALEELPVSAKLTTFENGELLMERLTKKESKIPDVLFLDLNMPRKNGYVTLGEIKRNNELDSLPVIIFSSAFEKNQVNQVFRDAAHYYIRKPNDFSELKKIINTALTLITQGNNPMPEKEKFIITGDVKQIPIENKSPSKKSLRKIN